MFLLVWWEEGEYQDLDPGMVLRPCLVQEAEESAAGNRKNHLDRRCHLLLPQHHSGLVPAHHQLQGRLTIQEMQEESILKEGRQEGVALLEEVVVLRIKEEVHLAVEVAALVEELLLEEVEETPLQEKGE